MDSFLAPYIRRRGRRRRRKEEGRVVEGRKRRGKKEKEGENVYILGLGKDFLGKTEKAQTIPKYDILDLVKSKIFWSLKNILNKMKK